MLAGGNGAVVWAEQRVPSGVTSLLIGTTPFWLLFFDWKWRKTSPPHAVHWIGVFIGMSGMALLVAPERWAGVGQADPLGAVFLLLASILWSAGSVWARKHPGPDDPAAAACIQMAAGAAAFLVMGLIAGETAGFSLASVSIRSWVAILYLLVGGSLIGYTAWVYLLKHTTAARAGTATFVNPLVAVLLGWLIAGEMISPRLLLAAPLILLSVFLMARKVDVKEEGSVA